MKFSVIIPAHNSAEYIGKALESVRMQTFTDYELIVVCDACEDETEEVARKYGAKTIVVDYERDGLTRNAGIDAAQGEYILFIDDDDWWMHEYVLEILDRALTGEDVLCFSFIWKGKGYAKCDNYIAVWNKCWKRTFIGDTRFSDKLYWSDVDFHEAAMKKNPTIKYLDCLMYYYNYMREGSISFLHG